MTPWLRVLAPRPAAKMRLVCLAHAGGGPAAFRDWPAAFPEWIELVGFLPPGREGRFAEPALNTITQLADGLVAALATLDDKPVALFGHSLGGLIAFEASHRLKPAALIISATRIPTATKPPIVLHELNDDDLRVELSRPPAFLYATRALGLSR